MNGVLFIDTVATTPYDEDSLVRGGLGGTEATVIRVATGLARAGRPVYVAQRARKEPAWGASGVRYIPYEHRWHRPLPQVEAIVVVRADKLLPRLRALYPHQRLLLWMHCFPGRRLRRLAAIVVQHGAALVAVSHHHRQWMQRFYQRHDRLHADRLEILAVPNPVDDDLASDGTPFDPDKLLFLSSPHKGLDEVVRCFEHVRRVYPATQLHVANPGYLQWPVADGEPAIVQLGSVPHWQVIAHLRDAFCLFYPQTRFAETFGLVLAEANAVGTPVLAHPVGAAAEVLGRHPEQLVDCRDPDRVVARLEQWRNHGRPRVGVDPRFRLRRVLEAWNGVLDQKGPLLTGPARDSYPEVRHGFAG